MKKSADLKNLKNTCKKIRKNILEMSLSAGASSSHFGGSLSTVEILACLFEKIMILSSILNSC